MSEKIAFRRKHPYSCPAFGMYYIQSRPAGTDINGNGVYEYALFQKQPFVLVKRFRTRKQAYEWLGKRTALTRFDVEHGSIRVILNDKTALGVCYGCDMFKLDRRTRTVYTRPTEDLRLTVWYDKYVECVKWSKKIIAEREGSQ